MLAVGRKILDDDLPEYTDKYDESKLHRAKLVLLHARELRFEIASLNGVWQWYYEHFGETFLRPSEPDPISMSEIVDDLKRRGLLDPSRASGKEEESIPLPSVAEIEQRTARIRSLITNLRSSNYTFCFFVDSL
jgi:hypothetical protein